MRRRTSSLSGSRLSKTAITGAPLYRSSRSGSDNETGRAYSQASQDGSYRRSIAPLGCLDSRPTSLLFGNTLRGTWRGVRGIRKCLRYRRTPPRELGGIELPRAALWRDEPQRLPLRARQLRDGCEWPLAAGERDDRTRTGRQRSRGGRSDGRHVSEPFDRLRGEPQSYRLERPGIGTFFTVEDVGLDFFQLYGLKPLAGRLFSRARREDAAPADTPATSGERFARDPSPACFQPVIINETAARKFGFSSPSAAVGQFVQIFGDAGEAPRSEIIGVAPDFPFRSLRAPVGATVFHLDPGASLLDELRRQNSAARVSAGARVRRVAHSGAVE